MFLVRHGESEWNRRGLIQGQSMAAPGLSATGVADSVAAAGRLAGSGVQLVVASDLRRATETAALIAAELVVPLRAEPRLRERNLGTIEGRPGAVVGGGETGVGAGAVAEADARPAGGESLREVYDRIAGLLEEMAADPPAECYVLVSHGGPIRMARAYFAGEPVDSILWAHKAPSGWG